MPKKKKRYKVAPGDNYLTIAANTGSSPDALASANPAVSTPSPGFYVNVPPGFQEVQSGATTYDYFTSPLTPPPLTGTAGYTVQTPAATPPVWNPMGNAESASRVGAPPTPILPSTSLTATGNGEAYWEGDPGDKAYMDNVISQVQVVEDYIMTAETAESIAVYQGVTDVEAYMTESGFVFDAATNTWTRGAATPVQPRNAGGWYTSSDGSTHLNRNQSQIDRRKERRNKNNSNSSQSAVINWSL